MTPWHLVIAAHFVVAAPTNEPAAPAASVPVSVSVPPPRPSLETAWKREVALLEAERAALKQQRVDIDSAHTARVSSLRKDVAGLEAALLEARAKNDALAADLSTLERAGAIDPAAMQASVAALGALLRKQGVDASDASLSGLLDAAVSSLERGARVERMDSAFFDSDGTWRDGRIIRVGALAAVASSGDNGPAGALVGLTPHTPGRLVRSDHDAWARRFVAEETGLAPLALGDVGANAGVSETDDKSWWSAVQTGGPALWLVLGVGMSTLAAALAYAVTLWRARRSARGAVDDIVSLVEQSEGGAAIGMCRALRGPAAALWSTVVHAALRAGPDEADEQLADALPEAHARVERGQPVLMAGLAVTVLCGAAAMTSTDGAHWGPLTAALVLATPLSVLLALTSTLARSLNHELERGALRLADAARAARGGER